MPRIYTLSFLESHSRRWFATNSTYILPLKLSRIFVIRREIELIHDCAYLSRSRRDSASPPDTGRRAPERNRRDSDKFSDTSSALLPSPAPTGLFTLTDNLLRRALTETAMATGPAVVNFLPEWNRRSCAFSGARGDQRIIFLTLTDNTQYNRHAMLSSGVHARVHYVRARSRIYIHFTSATTCVRVCAREKIIDRDTLRLLLLLLLQRVRRQDPVTFPLRLDFRTRCERTEGVETRLAFGTRAQITSEADHPTLYYGRFLSRRFRLSWRNESRRVRWERWDTARAH